MKIFLRPDMDGDREIWAIRDGSKLRQNITLLQWSSRDLYGFVWHWFLHSSDTRAPFAKMAHSVSDVRISIASGERLVKIPDAFMEDENLQKKIFEMISGDMMGAGSKKGHPFTWIPKHLADARGRVSLRSFIIALREAARSTPNSSSTPLAYDAIKKGVQQASLNRVEQLKEDYAWIDDVLKPLANLQTPNEAKSFIERWEAEKTIEKILDAQAANKDDYLIPVELYRTRTDNRSEYESLITALLSIGVAEKRPDGRINVPDLFQVASGLLRKGGVPPIQ